MDVFVDDLLAGLLRATAHGGAAAGLAWIALRLLPGLSPSVRVAVWWLVALKFVVALAGVGAVPLPVMPAVPAVAAAGLLPAEAVTASPGPSWKLAVALAWAALVAFAAAVAIRHASRALGVARRADPLRDRRATALLARLRFDLGVARPVALRGSSEIDVPQVVGLFRPVIVLPPRALALDDAALRIVLAHELCHVRRADAALGLVPAAARVLFCFHPFARLAAREYVLAREAACDADVVRSLAVDEADYGSLLVDMTLGARLAAGIGLTAPNAPSSLRRRLMMLRQATDLRSRAVVAGWIVILVAAAAVVPFRFVARAGETIPAGAEPVVLVRNGEVEAISGTPEDIERAAALVAEGERAFVLYRSAGEAFVVRDASTVDAVGRSLASRREIGRAVDDLGGARAELAAKARQLAAEERERAAVEADRRLAGEDRLAADAEERARLHAEVERDQALARDLAAKDRDRLLAEIERLQDLARGSAVEERARLSAEVDRQRAIEARLAARALRAADDRRVPEEEERRVAERLRERSAEVVDRQREIEKLEAAIDRIQARLDEKREQMLRLRREHEETEALLDRAVRDGNADSPQ